VNRQNDENDDDFNDDDFNDDDFDETLPYVTIVAGSGFRRLFMGPLFPSINHHSEIHHGNHDFEAPSATR
jgi:hypothetical protein